MGYPYRSLSLFPSFVLDRQYKEHNHNNLEVVDLEDLELEVG